MISIPWAKTASKARMMSGTGTRSNGGFTLIEVMAAALILVAGVVFIYESFFVSLDVFKSASDYLNVASWIDEKIWQVQDDIARYGFLARIDKRGRVARGTRSFYWDASCNMIAESTDIDLYKIDLNLSWQAGSRRRRLSRVAYAIYRYDQ
jgi:prepilin-type N-terminal cleavage/methylation domain-containing protein